MMDSMKPIVTVPEGPWAPLVASIPHGGELVPQAILDNLLVDMPRNYADWYTHEVYSFLPEMGIPTLIARAHRLGGISHSQVRGLSGDSQRLQTSMQSASN